MRIAILTSSRADFGIYYPLLKKMQNDNFFQIDIIAFGTHLSYFHGYTVNEIKEAGFDVNHTIESMVLGDSKESVSTAIGLTQIKFASFWAANSYKYDIVFCLGDRYEMFAAVSAGLPFNIKFAHIHGGEKSLGAIDNTLRHAISLISTFHFVSTNIYAKRLQELLEYKNRIYNVGALSLDNLAILKLYTVHELEAKWELDFSKPNILLTLHPETTNGSSTNNALVIVKVVKSLSEYNFIITMPNVDNGGNEIRKVFEENFADKSNVILIESLGIRGYLSCFKYVKAIVGNSSSGIIEAASFNRYVINIGDRQKGRATSENVVHVKYNVVQITNSIRKILLNSEYNKGNIYWNGGASQKIIHVLKQYKKNE